jgi:hypothetical protein
MKIKKLMKATQFSIVIRVSSHGAPFMFPFYICWFQFFTKGLFFSLPKVTYRFEAKCSEEYKGVVERTMKRRYSRLDMHYVKRKLWKYPVNGYQFQ